MYKHVVHYYETDKMGITHHSNYIRFMEEARMQFFKEIGFGYMEFENAGFFSPVVALNNCKFKKPTSVEDEIQIDIKVKQYNGIRLTVQYFMYVDNALVFEGESEHCFVSKEGKIIKINDKFPDLHKKLNELVEPSQN